MPHFLLLLHERPSDFAGVSPEEMQSIIEKYSAWRAGLQAAGRLAGSNKLTDEGGKSLTRVDGDLRVVDGPYSEAQEVVGGYFLIEAADYDEAVEVSAGCPHLDFGGRIELRQVDALTG